MDLSAKQIDEKPKKVGNLHGKPVYHLRTKGGLHILVTPGGTGYETLGTGPHRAVARHIAQKHEPEIVWSELSKSDHVDIEAFEMVLPKYENLTDALRAICESEPVK
jgi:hypothetical protein